MSVSDAATPILNGVYKLKNDSGQDASYAFQILPDRKLHDYYRVIKRPMALNIIRANLKAQKYTTFSQFMVDMAQIPFNARIYNPPESFIYTDALVLEEYLKDQLARLRQTGVFEPSELEYPDLGQQSSSTSSAAVSAGYEDDSGDSMDDSDSEHDDRDDYGRRRRRPVRRSVILSRRKREGEFEEEPARHSNSSLAGQVDKGRMRGRPPTVDKPHEHRIKAIMRAVRRERDPSSGRLLFHDFEKLPDPKLFPDYYEIVKQPIALDSVRKNIKRRQYSCTEQFLQDLRLLFSNALLYNEEQSQIYQDAATLQNIMNVTADEELKKPDSAYHHPDSGSKISRVPLDHVEHRGEQYKVGDWVHISNPNDPAKPTIGQIFRIWQAEGEQWINACWYYRPEQTVHKYDKLFYENEVVKSGQYRDHLVEEILEKCFVMFITKYQRGRPAGFAEKSVYCCESRYNEQERSFNKIRTWKACIPDEVRASDYVLEPFERMRTLRRVISPIKHLLPADASDDDPLPWPKMGAPNAPPIVGAVYKRPYDPDDPPEEPTGEDDSLEDSKVADSTTEVPAEPSALAASNKNALHARFAPGLQMYAQGGRPFSGMAGVPGGTPTAMPTAYVMPPAIVERLEPEDLAQVAKLPDGQLSWFPSCPIWVTHRILADPLPSNSHFHVEGYNRGQPLVSAQGFGHSATYMALKLKKIKTKK